jgi:spore germination protein
MRMTTTIKILAFVSLALPLTGCATRVDADKPAFASVGYYTDDPASLAAAKAHANSLTAVSADVYAVSADGKIAFAAHPEELLQWNRERGIESYLCVANYAPETEFDASIAHAALSDHAVAVIDRLVELCASVPYDGVNIDFENVPAADRALLTLFIERLALRLHADSKKLMISVPAKSSDQMDDDWNGAFDYAELAKHADYLQLMTYDEHGTWSEPGAVAGYEWVEACVDYALTVVPGKKLLIGLAAYGYDWNLDDTARSASISWKGVSALRETHGAIAKWDDRAQAPSIEYTDASGDRHVAWFENERSIGQKTALASRRGLAGVSVWSLGQEDQSFWDAVGSGW